MKKAIISGFSGQDGSYLSKLLLDKQYKVYGLTRNTAGVNSVNLAYLGIENEIEVLEVPQLNKEQLVKIVADTKPDEVYNLAAQSSVGASFHNSLETVSYNTLSVLSWLEAIKEVDTGIRFYQASSSEMFGNIHNLPLRESLIFHPASPYGVSKAAAHWLTVNYREANKMFCSCGILFNHESVLRGQNYVVKKIISNAVKIQEGLSDSVISLGNTSIKRDWGYAPLFVDAMWRILQHASPEDFLICSGNVMSLDDLVHSVFQKLGLDKERYLRIDTGLYRPSELNEIYGDNTKAKDELGWEYALSNDELIEKLIEDERSFISWKQQQKGVPI